MKHIKFKRLSIKNFLSVGETPVVIDFNQGMNVITGFNRDESDIKNGVGKTCIINAFYYAIFGSTLKKINKNNIPNRINKGGTEVILEFLVDSRIGCNDFKIIRKISPSKLQVFKDGVEKTRSSIAETTKYISDILSSNEEIFKNCIIMQSNNTISFMSKDKIDKKNFIENIFNLDIFSLMGRQIKDEMNKSRREYDIKSTLLSSKSTNLYNYKIQLDTALKKESDYNLNIDNKRKELEDFIKKQEEIVKLNKLEISTIEVNDIDKEDDIKDKLNDDLRKVIILETRTKEKISTIMKRAKELSKLGSSCDKCNRPYDESHHEIIKNEVLEIKQSLIDLKNKLTKLNNTKIKIDACIKKNNNTKKENKKIQLRFYELKNEIKTSLMFINDYKKQILELTLQNTNNAVKSFEELIKNTEIEIDVIRKEVDSLQKNLGKLDICKFILSEEGVRSYIVNKLLSTLNECIRFYLNAFKSTFDFTFNEFFEEEIKDSLGNICSYYNCSGAEMKKIDLATSFAFLDILKYQSNIDYNIAFYDEILDSSLDNKSLETVINVINDQGKKDNKCIYIISHKTDIDIPEINDTIILEKIDGFTKIMN